VYRNVLVEMQGVISDPSDRLVSYADLANVGGVTYRTEPSTRADRIIEFVDGVLKHLPLRRTRKSKSGSEYGRIAT
jgi:hypothetical protein